MGSFWLGVFGTASILYAGELTERYDLLHDANWWWALVIGLCVLGRLLHSEADRG